MKNILTKVKVACFKELTFDVFFSQTRNANQSEALTQQREGWKVVTLTHGENAMSRFA